jgi:carotenoid cleavage dioxygenase-like enzyme
VFNFNKLVKFDRQTEKSIEHVFNDSSIGEPALIRTKDGLFVLVLVTKKETEKSYVSIMDGDSLKLLAELELPEIVPFGFHGKW